MTKTVLVLPAEMRFRLKSKGSVRSLAGLLVSINTYSDGRYYFGGARTLTSQAGTAVLSRSEVEEVFQASRELFPMDYRVPLDACDPLIEIIVLGGDEFIKARAAAISSPLVLTKWKDLWTLARNESVRTARKMVPVPPVEDGQDILAIDVEVGTPI